MATIKLEVVSPDQMVYEQDIAMLIVRSTCHARQASGRG